MSVRRILLFLALVVAICGQTFPADVTLVWDASISQGVTGYYLRIGNASRVYDQNIDVGDVLIYQMVSLTEGRWFFTLQAYNEEGQVSDYSNEVFVVVNHNDEIEMLSPPFLRGGEI